MPMYNYVKSNGIFSVILITLSLYDIPMRSLARFQQFPAAFRHYGSHDWQTQSELAADWSQCIGLTWI